MQSITWGAARGLFPDTFKTAANNQAINRVWQVYQKGVLLLDDARSQILNLAGGIKPPDWYRPGGSNAEALRPSGDAGKLSALRLPDRPSGAMDSGAGSGTPARAAGGDGLHLKLSRPLGQFDRNWHSLLHLFQFQSDEVADPARERIRPAQGFRRKAALRGWSRLGKPPSNVRERVSAAESGCKSTRSQRIVTLQCHPEPLWVE